MHDSLYLLHLNFLQTHMPAPLYGISHIAAVLTHYTYMKNVSSLMTWPKSRACLIQLNCVKNNASGDLKF